MWSAFGHTLATGLRFDRSSLQLGLWLALAGMATAGWCATQVRAVLQRLSAPLPIGLAI